MPRSARGVALHGWLVIDKPAGVTSAAAVGQVRRAANAAKVGHAGTLDPMATGVLPLAFGEATKTVGYAMEGAKTYRFTVRWGEQRTTDDREGEVFETSLHRPDSMAIQAALPRFVGEIEQVPPTFSAVKLGGQRAYALARAAQPIDLAPRRVRIARLDLVAVLDADYAEFEAVTGKGTYMRALARDLARALGTVGHIDCLRRTAVGPFGENQAIPLDKAVALGHSGALRDHLLPVETALDDIPALALTEAEARSLRRGQAVPVLPVASRSALRNISQGDVVCAMAEGRLVALAQVKGGEIRPLRVLNL